MNFDSVKLLEDLEADAALVNDGYNIRYLSGFTGGEALLYISRDRRVLITDSRYTQAAKNESDFEVREWNASNGRTDILEECIEADNVRRLAYEDGSMLCSEFSIFCKRLSKVREWVPAGQTLNDMRSIKTPEELEYLRMAENIGDEAFLRLLKALKPGITELDVVAELEYLMRKCGGQGTGFDTIAASGLNSSMPHAVPSAKKLEEGDFLTLDFGCRYNGYCSDMTRTVVIGKADDDQKKIYNTVLGANLAAERMIREGVRCSEADRTARSYIEARGYGKYFGHALGHGVGLFIHENPRLSARDETILKAGMVVTVEPGIYIPGFGGVRIEDMVAITEDGYENLSHSPKELIEIC